MKQVVRMRWSKQCVLFNKDQVVNLNHQYKMHYRALHNDVIISKEHSTNYNELCCNNFFINLGAINGVDKQCVKKLYTVYVLKGILLISLEISIFEKPNFVSMYIFGNSNVLIRFLKYKLICKI